MSAANESIVRCPKCGVRGILYSNRAIGALIAAKHIAHVMHVSESGRRACLLTRTEFERLETAEPEARTKSAIPDPYRPGNSESPAKLWKMLRKWVR